MEIFGSPSRERHIQYLATLVLLHQQRRLYRVMMPASCDLPMQHTMCRKEAKVIVTELIRLANGSILPAVFRDGSLWRLAGWERRSMEI